MNDLPLVHTDHGLNDRPTSLGTPSLDATDNRTLIRAVRWIRSRLAHWTHRAKSDRGTSTVEAALVFPILVAMMCGIGEFGIFFSNTIVVANSARAGARWATTHPSSWASGTSPASNTIEGQVVQAAGSLVSSPDSVISIKYFIPNGTSTPTQCGHITTGAFVSDNSYTQTQCLVAGNMILVQVSYTYTFFTPYFTALFPSGLQVAPSATMLEEV